MPNQPIEPTSESVIVEVTDPHGLHLREAGELAKLCMGFKSKITLRKENGSRKIDCRSMLAILTLSAPKDTRLVASAEGPDAADALAAVQHFFATMPQN